MSSGNWKNSLRRSEKKFCSGCNSKASKILWARADALMKDAPKVSEDEILRLPRVRPSGF